MEVALSKGGLQDEFFLEYVCDRDLNTNTHTHICKFVHRLFRICSIHDVNVINPWLEYGKES